MLTLRENMCVTLHDCDIREGISQLNLPSSGAFVCGFAECLRAQVDWKQFKPLSNSFTAPQCCAALDCCHCRGAWACR